jgi:hypothetical protein
VSTLPEVRKLNEAVDWAYPAKKNDTEPFEVAMASLNEYNAMVHRAGERPLVLIMHVLWMLTFRPRMWWDLYQAARTAARERRQSR